jgi:hypothetical protein
MHIGDHRDAVGVFDGLKDGQTLLKAWATKGVDGRPIRFVVRGFEHQGNAEAFTDSLVVASAVQGEVQVLQDIYTSQKDKGLVVRERDVSELYLSGHDRVTADDSMSLRGLFNCCSKSGFFGHENNSFKCSI